MKKPAISRCFTMTLPLEAGRLPREDDLILSTLLLRSQNHSWKERGFLPFFAWKKVPRSPCPVELSACSSEILVQPWHSQLFLRCFFIIASWHDVRESAWRLTLQITKGSETKPVLSPFPCTLSCLLASAGRRHIGHLVVWARLL